MSQEDIERILSEDAAYSTPGRWPKAGDSDLHEPRSQDATADPGVRGERGPATWVPFSVLATGALITGAAPTLILTLVGIVIMGAGAWLFVRVGDGRNG